MDFLKSYLGDWEKEEGTVILILKFTQAEPEPLLLSWEMSVGHIG